MISQRRINTIELGAVIIGELRRQGVTELSMRELDVIARAASSIFAEIYRDGKEVTPGMGLEAWLKSDETDPSSMFMAYTLSHITGVHWAPFAGYEFPRLVVWFKRCLGLLEAVPEFVKYLKWMGETGPEWSALIDHWDELDASLRRELPSGNAPETYAMLRDILERVPAA